MKKQIFISYGHDQYVIFARKIKEDLEAVGHDVWYDEEKLKSGRFWEGDIEAGLAKIAEASNNGLFIFLMTPHSVRRKDSYCLNELSYAIIKNINILPVMIVDCEPPLSICRHQWFDMRDCVPFDVRINKYNSKFKQLIDIIDSNSIELEGTQKNLQKLLEPIDFNYEVTKHLEKFSGREWLIEKIDKWLFEPLKINRVFWITGVPGIGKSAISSWLCENRSEIIAQHFCVFGNEEKNDPVRLIKSITFQISTQLPEYYEQLCNMDIAEIINKYNNPFTLFSKFIAQPLSKISEHDKTKVILIDALDEANKNNKNLIADLIANEFDKTPQWLKLIITSRPDNEVVIPLQKFSPYIIDAACDENIIDVKKYFSKKIEPFINSFDPKKKEEVIETVINKSEGIFLYINCLLEELKKGTLNITDIDKFPKSLGSIYKHFFDREFKDIDFYKDKIRPALSIIISSYEPFNTGLLKAILLWNDSELNDFIELLGSLFILNKKDENETITVFHLSITDWLTDKEKSSPYYFSLKDGQKKLAEYGLSEYNKFKSNKDYELDSYIIKWLPLLLLETNNSKNVADLLCDIEFTQIKIKSGFTELLFEDFRRLFLLLNNKNDIAIFHKVLISSINAHIYFFNLSTETIKNILSEDYKINLNSILNSVKNFNDRERFIIYIITIYSILINNDIRESNKMELLKLILTEVNEFSLKVKDVNWVQYIPISFMTFLVYKFEELDLDCSILFRGAKSFDHFTIALMNNYEYDEIDNEIGSLDHEEIYLLFLLKVLKKFEQQGLIENALKTKNKINNFSNNQRSIKEIGNVNVEIEKKIKTENKRLTKTISTTISILLFYFAKIIFFNPMYFLTRLFYFPFKYILLVYIFAIKISIKTSILLKKANKNKLNVFKKEKKYRKTILYKIYFFLAKLQYNRAKMKKYRKERYYDKREYIPIFLYFLICNKKDNIRYKIEILSNKINKLTESKINLKLIHINSLIIKLNDPIVEMFHYSRLIKILTIKEHVKFLEIYCDKLISLISKANSESQKELMIYHVIDLFAKVNITNDKIVNLLIKYFEHGNRNDNKLTKMLSIGDVAFISDDKEKMMNIQRNVFESFEDIMWKYQIGYGSGNKVRVYYDWSLVFPDIGISGLFNPSCLEKSYNSLSFFIENYEAVRSEDPSCYFPEFAGMNHTDEELSLIDEVLFSELFHKTENKIEKHLNNTTITSQKRLHINDTLKAIALLDFYDKKIYTKKIKKFFKNQKGILAELFIELYPVGNIENGIKIILEINEEKNPSLLIECVFLFTQYTINNSLITWVEILIEALIDKKRFKSLLILIGFLLNKGLLEMVLKAIENISGIEEKDKIYGYIAFHKAKTNQLNESQTYIDNISDDSEKDKWLQKVAVLALMNGHMDVSIMFSEQINYINNKAFLTCTLSEVLRNKGLIKEADEFLYKSYISAKKLTIDKDSKKKVITNAVSIYCTNNYMLALEGISCLSKDSLISKKAINHFLKIIYANLFKNNEFKLSYETLQNYPDSNVTFISVLKFLPIKTIIEIAQNDIKEDELVHKILKESISLLFRNKSNTENWLFHLSGLVINNPTRLYEILYRYAAYTAFCSKQKSNEKINILNEINEVIDIDDWLKEAKKH